MFRKMFRRQHNSTDFSTEVQAHIQLEEERLREQGLSPEEAHNRAYRAFGNVTKTQERFYESRHWLFWDNLWRDLRYAFRMLRKSPSFTLVAILTLAVAIGANAVVFSALNALVLRPLNVPHSESLYLLERTSDKYSADSYPNYLDLRDRNRSFDGLAAFSFTQPGFDTGENPTSIWGYDVTGNYFNVLGIHPYLGRLIQPSDESGPYSAPAYIVLTYGFWRSHFQSDRAVVGRTVRLNKKPFTIIGVTPPGFSGTLLIFSPSFFVPIANEDPSLLQTRGNRWLYTMLGHLKPGVTPARATADLNSVTSYLQKTYPKEDDRLAFLLGRPSLGGDFLGAGIRAFLAALMLLAGLILLAACANLGSLFAARAADRSREVALRLALGASRLRILRQLFTEAILISLMGGALGLWGSVTLLRWLIAWRPFSQYPLNIAVSPDATVYLMALLLALASGFLFSAVPVRQVLRTDPYQIVKSGSLANAGRRITARDFLLAVQIAICAVLVTSSFVAVRGLARSLHSNFGFQPDNTILAETDLTSAGYTDDKVPVMQKRMLEAMQTIPGADSVAFVGAFPPLHMGWDSSFVFTDQTSDLRPSNAAADAVTYEISPEYFHTAGTALLAGRTFTWDDDKKAPRVAVVNQQFARKVFGSVAGAMGGYFKLKDRTRIQVVGIVEDGKYTNLTEDPQSAMFLPILQLHSNDAWLIVRSNRDSYQLAAAIKEKMRGLDSGLPVFIQTWNEEMSGVLFAPRMATASLGLLGVLGAILSITGIFGMASYSVSKRRRELGIRMALGAQHKEVLQAALGRAVKLLAFGSAAGLLLGILASRVLAFIVYQATPRDPLVLAGVVLAMALVGLLATWIPAQRALSIDPATLLREE